MTMCDRFDPLSSDEPLDHDAIVADERLINALARGDHDAVRELVGSDDDVLLTLIAGWITDVHPAPAAPAEVHLMPAHARAAAGAVVTECCDRRLDDLPGALVTDDPDVATCSKRRP